MYFCLVIMDTVVVKKVHKGKRRKPIVTGCKHSCTITISRQKGAKGVYGDINFIVFRLYKACLS